METPTLEQPTTAEAWQTKPFRTAAVLGAGTMGAQIAAHLANAGLHVHLLDIAPKEGTDKNAIVAGQWKKAQRLKPDPFFTKAAAQRVTLGNFDEHFDRLAEADWVIEVVVERMDIKRSVMERIEATARPDAVISTNTSGLPIAHIAEGRSDDFKRRFLGTHFFNPPRYLKLLEVIPTGDTDPAVVQRVANFARVHLGKGIVIAKDSPYFIGNRIGMYGIMRVMEYFTDHGYSIEELDTLTGTMVGRPKSATFRTADVVGLDVMKHVAENLYEAVPEDESREAFQIPNVLSGLVATGALGAKTKAGFYKKEGKQILSINPESGEYEEARELNLGDLDAINSAGGLEARLNALYEAEGRAGAFFRNTTRDLLGYTARRLGEIADNPADVDRAVSWGFGWRLGPFQIWDALGFDRLADDMRAHDIALPDWVQTMQDDGVEGFYRTENGETEVYVPSEQQYIADERPADEISLAAIKSDESKVVWKNPDASLIDLGDGVVLYEFRSKANSLGFHVMSGLVECIEKVENDRNLRGLVVGNEGTNFSVGANLGEVAMAMMMGQFDEIEQQVGQFQQAIQRVRYASKPVVVVPHQRALGGACEMTMACPHPVAAAETYIGLVELGVGLIPAGTGTTRLAALAAANAPNGHVSEIQAWLNKYFETVAMATVATSARMAQEQGFISKNATIVMNAERRFHVAQQEVLRLSEQGYLPPPADNAIMVLGTPARATMEVGVYQFLGGGFISEYDFHLAKSLAYVLTGGDLTGPQPVPEQYLLDLEREVFLRLLGEEKTQARIAHILEHNKPLRN